MLILAIDSTAVAASVAVADINDGFVTGHSSFVLKNKLTHSETLMPMIDSALKVYGRTISDVELIAVNAGPGSFTGVRIGVATAKGLADGLGIKCASVSTLDSLSRNVEGFSGIICPLMDARRGQFYNALFKGAKRLCPDRAISAEELSAEIDSMSGRVILCGDGAHVFKELYRGKKRLVLAPAVAVDQNALSTAICGYEAYKNNTCVDSVDLKPVYLRMSQAERMRNQ